MMEFEQLQSMMKILFPGVLGVELTRAEPDLVEGELTIRDELCTVPGRAHGGVLMAFADTLGALATVLNLPEGASTTTLESKTNFLRVLPWGRGKRGLADRPLKPNPSSFRQ